MTTYRVQWIIDIEADTPEDAATEAQNTQRDPESIATCFTVFERVGDNLFGPPVEVDTDHN